MSGETTPDIAFEIPVRTVSELNQRGNWRAHFGRHKRQHRAAFLNGCAENLPGLALPATIRLTRIAPRLLDSDNAVASMKYIRDGLADAIGVDDGDERLTWEYRQEKSRRGRHAVRVEVWR